MAKWILVIIELLPKKAIVDLVINILEMLAKKTDNDIDDAIVAIVKTILYKAIGLEDRKK